MRFVPAQSTNKRHVSKTNSGSKRIQKGNKPAISASTKAANHKSSSKNTKVLNRATKKYFQQLVLGSVIFVASLLFLGGYTLVKYLNQTFASALSPSSYNIDGQSIVTVSFSVVEDINADPILLKELNYFIFDKTQKTLQVYSIPVDLSIDMPGKFGSDQISKTYAITALNAKDPVVDGVAGINTVVKKIFGYNVDRYLMTDEKDSLVLKQLLLGNDFSNIFNLKTLNTFRQSVRTDMNLREFYSLISLSKSLPADVATSYIVSQDDIDNSQKIDEALKDLRFDSEVTNEGLTVGILNGTDYPGVATFGARLARNEGCRVVSVENADSKYDTSVLITDRKDSKTVAYLSRAFNIDKILTKNEAQNYNEAEIARSDVTVVMGFDIASDMY